MGKPAGQSSGPSQGVHDAVDNARELAGGGGAGNGIKPEDVAGHEAYATDKFFRNFESMDFDEMNEHEKAFYALYNAPEHAETQLMDDLKNAGDARNAIRVAIRKFYFSVFKRELKPKSQEETDFLIGIQVELNKYMDQLYEDFGSKKRIKEWEDRQREKWMRERGVAYGYDNDHFVPVDREGGRIGIDFLREDGGARRHMTDAWIRFATRRDKGSLTLPVEVPKELESSKKPKGIGEVVADVLSVDEAPYVAQMNGLASAGVNLAKEVTRRVNSVKTGDAWPAAAEGLRILGVDISPEAEEDAKAEFIKAYRMPPHETIQEFLNKQFPDVQFIGETEIENDNRKWSPLVKETFRACLKERKNKIPIQVAESFTYIMSKHLESTDVTEGMEKHLNHGKTIPKEIMVEIGRDVLVIVIEEYIKSGSLPEDDEEWYKTFKDVQDARVDLLVKSEHGKYYKKKEGEITPSAASETQSPLELNELDKTDATLINESQTGVEVSSTTDGIDAQDDLTRKAEEWSKRLTEAELQAKLAEVELDDESRARAQEERAAKEAEAFAVSGKLPQEFHENASVVMADEKFNIENFLADTSPFNSGVAMNKDVLTLLEDKDQPQVTQPTPEEVIPQVPPEEFEPAEPQNDPFQEVEDVVSDFEALNDDVLPPEEVENNESEQKAELKNEEDDEDNSSTPLKKRANPLEFSSDGSALGDVSPSQEVLTTSSPVISDPLTASEFNGWLSTNPNSDEIKRARHNLEIFQKLADSSQSQDKNILYMARYIRNGKTKQEWEDWLNAPDNRQNAKQWQKWKEKSGFEEELDFI